MKNILSSISQSEKNRILEMHRSATRKNYLFEQETQVFDSNYFNTNKTGTVKFNPAKGFPEVIEVNNIPYSDYTFYSNWTFDDSIFTGKAPAGWKGNNVWKYVYDGTKLKLTPADGNTDAMQTTITFNPSQQ